MLFPAEQAFVGRDEKRAPLKTPAWEATTVQARHVKYFLDSFAVKNDGDSASVFGPDAPLFSDLTGCLKKITRSTLGRNLLG